MQVKHPQAGDGDGVPPAKVDVNGEKVPVDEDGTFEVDSESWLQRFANGYDTDLDDLLVDEDDSSNDEDTEANEASDSDDGLSFDPGDHKVDEVEAHVEQIDGSDIVAELEAIRAAEADGKDRSTALDAIDSRLDDVEE